MKILFATDGSLHSDNALEEILSDSWPAGSECLVVTVRAPFHNILAAIELNFGAFTAESALEADLQKMLLEAEQKLAQKFGKQKVTIRILAGSPPGEIVKLADSWGSDLIVIGSHGLSGYNDEMLGSTVNLVMNHAHCHVRVVQYVPSESLEKRKTAISPYEETHILLAIDGSDTANAVIDSVLSRTWPQEAVFQILAIVPEPKTVFHSRFFKDKAFDDAHKKLYAMQKEHLETIVNEAASKLESKFGKQKVTRHALEGNVPSLILQIAQDWPADMIMIGAHDRDTSIFQQFLGSVTQNVTQNAHCSVEIVRVPH